MRVVLFPVSHPHPISSEIVEIMSFLLVHSWEEILLWYIGESHFHACVDSLPSFSNCTQEHLKQPYIKLVCKIRHSKSFIVVTGADEQCLLQDQNTGLPEAHAKVCVGTGV